MGHHVALSVVGSDRLLASGYFRAKMAQENLIEASGIPYTIVRATQFFEFLAASPNSTSSRPTVHLSLRRCGMQSPPMTVPSALAEVTLGAPLNGMIEIVARRTGLGELVTGAGFLDRDKTMASLGEVIADVDARYYGQVVNLINRHPRRSRALARLHWSTGQSVHNSRQDYLTGTSRYPKRSRKSRIAISNPATCPVMGARSRPRSTTMRAFRPRPLEKSPTTTNVT